MKVFIETYGCSANQSNSELIGGLLAEAGHKLVSFEDAGLVILNTCTVKIPTERKVLKRIAELRQSGKKVLVAGCMADVQAGQIRDANPGASLMGSRAVREITDVVSKIAEGYKVTRVTDKPDHHVCLPKTRINPVVNITQIAEGCTGNCAYCIVRTIKGSVFSYPVNIILRDIETSLNEGCREIRITSQDNAAYDYQGIKLPSLLRKFTLFPGKYKIRIGMMNPRSVLPILNELVKAYRHQKIYQLLHLPLQSGSDKILKAMNRKYTVEEFRIIIDAFRKEYPRMTISTDVIVGFPGEADEDFQKTVSLIKEIKPDIVNVSRYGRRPMTTAPRENEVPSWKIKERSQEISNIVQDITLEKNRNWEGWSGEVLISEIAPKGGFIARNFAYKPILMQSGKLGESANITVKEGRVSYMVA